MNATVLDRPEGSPAATGQQMAPGRPSQREVMEVFGERVRTENVRKNKGSQSALPRYCEIPGEERYYTVEWYGASGKITVYGTRIYRGLVELTFTKPEQVRDYFMHVMLPDHRKVA